jgi:hypothetical protein
VVVDVHVGDAGRRLEQVGGHRLGEAQFQAPPCPVKQLVDGRLGDQAPGADDGHPVGDAFDLGQHV